MDIGPIPLSKIQDYSDRHSLGDLFVRQILEIDRAYMADRGKKVARNGKK